MGISNRWEIHLKRPSYFVIFVILLFMPMVADFVFIHGPAELFLRDILFVEGVLLLVFGAQSGEFIWSFIRNWKRMTRERSYPTELMVGLALLAVGTLYVVVALLFPAGIIL